MAKTLTVEFPIPTTALELRLDTTFMAAGVETVPPLRAAVTKRVLAPKMPLTKAFPVVMPRVEFAVKASVEMTLIV